MRIAFFVNELETERVEYTTTLLARAALERGHDVWHVDAGGFSYGDDDVLRLTAHGPPGCRYPSDAAFLEAVQGGEAVVERIDVADLDVLLLRNDPAVEIDTRPWAQNVGVLFGQVAARAGVLVLNDPEGLGGALNKLYLQRFPPELRPRTVVTRDPELLREFVREHRGKGAVIKPLAGSGGRDVFLVRDDDQANVNQIIETVRRQGYAVAQEYVEAASEGDVRLFLLNGRPLEIDGRIAAFARVGREGDLRTNVSAGGTTTEARVTERMLELAELALPRLVQDGMFLVGLDIAGETVLEINVFSPGGLRIASDYQGVDFTVPVLDAMEAKVEHRRTYGNVRNRELATL